MGAPSYHRIRRLAVGGMGEIYLARRGTGELVVLKSLLPGREGAGTIAQMFAEEARLLMLLHHPNIVRVHQVFEERGEPVIAMEYIDGESLSVLLQAAILRASHRLEPFVQAVAQAARGLDAAHRALDGEGRPLNIVHRDVTPQNIMVGRDGLVKLVDFGIAKAAFSSVRTETGLVKGKLTYLAPEQLNGQKADGRSDLYALGVVLWEVSVGQRVFSGLNELEILSHIGSKPIPAPSSVVPGFDPALDRLIMKAVDRDPAARFQSGADFAAALEEFLSHRAPTPPQALGQYVELLVGPDLDRRRSTEPPPATSTGETWTSPGAARPIATPSRTPTDPASTQFPVAAEASLFEGLFRGVTLTDALRGDLARMRVDPERLEARYRVDVWARTVEVVRRHVYPDLPADEANRRLGFDFASGFEHTIGGRMVLSVLPFLNPSTLLARVPRFFKLGRPDIDISWKTTSKTSGTLRVKDVAQVSPFFDVGLIQYIVERMGAKARARVEWHSLTDFSIHYEW